MYSLIWFIYIVPSVNYLLRRSNLALQNKFVLNRTVYVVAVREVGVFLFAYKSSRCAERSGLDI